MLDALFLDFDGLILDTETTEYQALSQVFTEAGQHFEYSDWLATVGRQSPDWFAALAGTDTARIASLREQFEACQASLVAELPLRDGVADLIDVAEAAGVPVAVVTSGERARVCTELDRRGLLDWLCTVVSLEDVERTKPDAQPYLMALRRTGARAGHVIALEDSEHGVMAASAAGIRCVAVYNDVTRHQDFERADLAVGNIKHLDLTALIESGVARRHVNRHL